MKILVRLVLLLSAALSISVIIFVVLKLGTESTEAWATAAASLAVLTSIISSWSAQRVLEIEQESQQPYPYPSIDIKSRYGLMQLRVKNFGGGPAHEIRLIFDKPILNAKGEKVKFSQEESVSDIPVLLPQESSATLIDGTGQMYQKYEDMDYSGTIEFKDVLGKKRKHRFFISAESYRSSLTYDEEETKTSYELQKIPSELEKIRNEIIQLQKW